VTRDGANGRRRFLVGGLVQGVGFRPFVYNLAREFGLSGFVSNTSDGVIIEVQGPVDSFGFFEERLEDQAPPLSQITSLESARMSPLADEEGFVIVASADTPGTRTLIPPDTATCEDCLREIRDPSDRRHGYPFTNCTNCGPRWTIIRRIPYDRPFTSMADFTMCDACRTEYEDPGDRRFHAQPNACPECGPRVWLEGDKGRISEHSDPLEDAADMLEVGRVLAIKGLGGFHLAVRADDNVAVNRLRERKHREGKPLALMVADLETARSLATINEDEEAALATPQAPIVLLERTGDGVAEAVAPDHRRLGVMLPYTPLHHLLFDRLAERRIRTLVMTSGNASDEPICLDNDDARECLGGIADAWLMHDRNIVRRADDSVVQLLEDGPLFFRRSRGYAPMPVVLPGSEGPEGPEGPDVLAVGPELKNTVCVLKEDRAFLSPHIGDLENLSAFRFFTGTVETLEKVLECSPEVVAHDRHPGYFSTDWAKKSERRTVGVQHHHAHLAAVLAEHGHGGPAIGLIMDGTGYGDDGTIWGGEILAGDLRECHRIGHFEPVPLPGGDAAIRAPWRTAVSFLRHAYHADMPDLPWLKNHPVEPVMQMLARGVNSPLTSSCGRLFDAVAALTGRWPEVSYEAQAAIEFMALTDLESVMWAAPLVGAPPFLGDPFIVRTGPMVKAAAERVLAGADATDLSARFHNTMIQTLSLTATEARERTGLETVVLGGGVFQNEVLLRGLRFALTDQGFHVLRPLRVPPNDGAVALGQAVVARARMQDEQA
jgi:hydrogenase maturation protein HypF